MQEDMQIANVFMIFLTNLNDRDRCPWNQNHAKNTLCAFAAIHMHFEGSLKEGKSCKENGNKEKKKKKKIRNRI